MIRGEGELAGFYRFEPEKSFPDGESDCTPLSEGRSFPLKDSHPSKE